MKNKNKYLTIWAIMFVVAVSSNFASNASFDGIRNVDLAKILLIGFLAGGFVNEAIHTFKKAKE